jgi:hypothetical protein
MSVYFGNKGVRALAMLGAATAAAYAISKVVGHRTATANPVGLFDRLAQAVDQSVGWYRFPPLAAVVMLRGMRNILRAQNLYDTTTAPPPVPTAPSDGRYRTVRTVDGRFNDLENPLMGSANTRFGRNVPIALTYPGDERDILGPSPRAVSLQLLTRHAFTPATTLNLLAAAWLQFMIHDWFSHGKSQQENPWLIPLDPGDTWHEDPMLILRTADDPTRTSADDGEPPTHINTETHWWDASQLYGSTQQVQDYVRLKRNGYVCVGRDDIVNPPDEMIVGQPLLAGWWLGQSLLYTIFALEHNAICDALRAAYPSWSDDDLFDHARLVNAALIAKIHTVEWTPSILGSPTLKIAMNANWWGLAGEAVKKLLGRISGSELISGIPGAKTDHFGVPYAITEEFVAVYRMHPLMPDDITFRSAADDSVLQERTFGQIAGVHARERLNEMPILDIFYSFGRMHPGAIQLHNYPRALQDFERPDGRKMDLAAHDILRSRELGVPRYNDFRKLLHLKPFETFEEMTPNAEWAAEMRRVYDGDVEKVDVMVGMFAEQPPPGFGFSDTAFRIFILMASRRLNSDRFFTTDFTTDVYTPIGMDWINDNTMGTVLLRHYPALAPALRNVKNPFAPWNCVSRGGPTPDGEGVYSP